MNSIASCCPIANSGCFKKYFLLKLLEKKKNNYNILELNLFYIYFYICINNIIIVNNNIL